MIIAANSLWLTRLSSATWYERKRKLAQLLPMLDVSILLRHEHAQPLAVVPPERAAVALPGQQPATVAATGSSSGEIKLSSQANTYIENSNLSLRLGD